jgi:hypothetical protein
MASASNSPSSGPGSFLSELWGGEASVFSLFELMRLAMVLSMVERFLSELLVVEIYFLEHDMINLYHYNNMLVL